MKLYLAIIVLVVCLGYEVCAFDSVDTNSVQDRSVKRLSDLLNFYEASDACANLGMRLITLDTDRANNDISSVMGNMDATPENRNKAHWIGLSNENRNGNYYWTANGARVGRTAFEDAGHRKGLKEHCAKVLLKKGQTKVVWDEESCFAKLPSFCQDLPKPKV